MQTQQCTIQNAVTFTGIGIHSGCTTKITCLPAPPNHGIKFQRTDIEREPIVEATAEYVVNTDCNTTLQHNNASVATVEHLLSAISGLQIDNMLIQIDAPEVPILDGSAAPFVKSFEELGIANQDVQKKYFVVHEPITYTNTSTGTTICALPADDYKLSVMLEFENTSLHHQHAHLESLSTYPQEIAPTRTFVFLSHIFAMHQKGLIRGGRLDNSLVIVDQKLSSEEITALCKQFNIEAQKLHIVEGILNGDKMHFPNEPARHKTLDLIGDLALLGRPIKGQIIARKPSHAANVDFVKKLREVMIKHEASTIPIYNPQLAPVLEINQITKMLPHRYPFQLVDKIIQLDNRTITGIKNVTINEPFFQGHFPSNPIMPGVLQIEALVQTGGVLVLSSVPDPEKYATYFLAIEQCRFRKKVIPGDTLIMHCELLTDIKRGIVKMKGRSFVSDKLVCETIMTAQIVKERE